MEVASTKLSCTMPSRLGTAFGLRHVSTSVPMVGSTIIEMKKHIVENGIKDKL